MDELWLRWVDDCDLSNSPSAEEPLRRIVFNRGILIVHRRKDINRAVVIEPEYQRYEELNSLMQSLLQAPADPSDR